MTLVPSTSPADFPSRTAMHYWRAPQAVGIVSTSLPTFRFTSLVDTQTLIPAGQGYFQSFGLGYPALYQDRVVFWGAGAGQQTGLYEATHPEATHQGLRVIANRLTPAPEEGSLFIHFGSCPIFDRSHILFLAQTQTGRLGLYRDTDQQLTPLVITDQPVLQENFCFINLSNPAAQADFLTFVAKRSDTQQKGIIQFTQGHLRAIAWQGEGELLDISRPMVDAAGRIAFRGQDRQYQTLIYTYDQQGLRSQVTAQTSIPRGIGTFTAFGNPDIDQGRITFLGRGSVFQQGIYQLGPDGLTVIVDNQTRIPDSLETFATFQAFAVDGREMAFLAGDSYGRLGLFFASEGAFFKVIELGDKLDGQTILNLALGDKGLQAQTIVFKARFVDGTEGIFQAQMQA